VPKKETNAEEVAEQERLDAIKRGDFIEDIDEIDTENVDRGDEVDDEEEIVDEEEEIVDEDEEEEEEIVDEDEDDDDDDDDDDDEAPITVPKARFDEVQRKSRDKIKILERKLKDQEVTQHQESDQEKLDTLEEEIEAEQDKYEDLLMEGEVKDARAVRKAYTIKQKELNRLTLQANSAYTSSAAVEQTRFDIKLAQFESVHPEINPDAEEFDGETADEVAEVLSAFKARGYTATAALLKAVHYVLPEASSAAPKKDPDIVRQGRKVKGRKRVAKAIKKSPPDLRGKGKDSDKGGQDDGLPKASKMSMAQFDKLSEKDKRAMRGDVADEEAA
jgi:hypothetical protein